VTKQKIAILVIAHSSPGQLRRLCNHLAKEFDVYLHLDATSQLKPEDFLADSRVWVQKKFRCHWGTPGIVHATLSLMSLAEESSPGYDRYVLISGQDVPLKTNSLIRKHFEAFPDENFIECRRVLPEDKLMSRVSQFHWKPANKSSGLNWLLKVLISRTLHIAHLFLPPRRRDYEIFFGSNWMDLTGGTVKQILELVDTSPEFLTSFNHTLCPDEMFFQTATHLLGLGTCRSDGLLRYVDWTTGPEHPRTLRINDLESLLSSDALFARKLDERVDPALIDSLYARLM
jgi:hypothetical protein